MSDRLNTVLCRLEDIPDGQGRGFDIDRGHDIVEIFVVRRGGDLYGYQNVCPHAGTPLHWLEDTFMTLDGARILCATHGAEFRIEDGYCTTGPCTGDRLMAIEVELRDGAVVLQRL